MHRFSLVIIAICLVLVLSLGTLSITACTRTAYQDSFWAMNTYMDLTVYGNKKVLAECIKLAADLDRKLSVTDPASAVYALNKQGTPVDDKDVLALAQAAVRLSETTDGAFDVTIYPVSSLWGFTKGDYHVPTEAQLAEALAKVDYRKIDLSNGRLALPQGNQIDFGGIAKGYLGDVLKRYLVAQGVKSALLNLGGNVVAVGSRPDGKPYRVAIKDPLGEGYVCILSVQDVNVVTSGLYERYFLQDGVKYGHIIDPFTGYPVNNGLLSVTVVGEVGTDCDAYSTALFVMGANKACQVAKALGLQVVMVTHDTLYVSATLADGIQYQGQYASYKVVTL